MVKNAIKDPSGLKNLLQDQCDDMKRRKEIIILMKRINNYKY